MPSTGIPIRQAHYSNVTMTSSIMRSPSTGFSGARPCFQRRDETQFQRLGTVQNGGQQGKTSGIGSGQAKGRQKFSDRQSVNRHGPQ